MRKTISVILCLLVIAAICTPFAGALYETELPEETPGVFLLVNMDTDTVVFSKNADEKVAPASLTKIVTGLLTIEFCDDLDAEVTVPQYAVDKLLGTNSSVSGFVGGEVLTVRDLLNCLLIPSANDAANVLADFIGQGDMDAFITLMNDFAVAIGCTNTHFSNAHGLDSDDHYTCASDMYLIMKHALGIPEFRKIVGTYSYKVPKTNKNSERTVYSTNPLINSYSDYYYKYCSGGKTGTTSKAGACLVSYAERDGYTYVAVAMKGEFIEKDGKEINTAFSVSAEMFKWAFSNLKLRTVAEPSRIVDEMPVLLGKDVDYVSLVPEKEVIALIASSAGEDSLMIVPVEGEKPAELTAPVEKGQFVVNADVYYSDEVVAQVRLVAASGVEKSTVAAVMYSLKTFFSSTMFLIVLVVIAFLAVAFVVLYVANKKKKAQKEKARRAEKSAKIDAEKLK